MKKIYTLSLAVSLVAVVGCAQMQSAEERIGEKMDNAEKVFFIEPADGATLGREFKVVMGVKGMQIKPAGELTKKTGHHHLLIDTTPIPEGSVIPKSDKYLHFGKAQTETTLKLAPGKHTLMLQLGNGNHISYGENMRTAITVTVH